MSGGRFVSAINGNACISQSDYEKYGCPYCGCNPTPAQRPGLLMEPHDLD